MFWNSPSIINSFIYEKNCVISYFIYERIAPVVYQVTLSSNKNNAIFLHRSFVRQHCRKDN